MGPICWDWGLWCCQRHQTSCEENSLDSLIFTIWIKKFYSEFLHSMKNSIVESILTSFADCVEFMNFFQNSKNTWVVWYPCNIFESNFVSLMIKKIEVFLKIEGFKRRCCFFCCDFIRTTSIFLIIELFSKILHGYFTTFGILKNTYKFVKIDKTIENTLVFSRSLQKVPWPLKKRATVR